MLNLPGIQKGQLVKLCSILKLKYKTTFDTFQINDLFTANPRTLPEPEKHKSSTILIQNIFLAQAFFWLLQRKSRAK